MLRTQIIAIANEKLDEKKKKKKQNLKKQQKKIK